MPLPSLRQVASLLDSHVIPHLVFLFHLTHFTDIYSNKFREELLYHEEADRALRVNTQLCQALFYKYGSYGVGHARKKQFLTFTGWSSMLTDGGVLSTSGSEDAGARVARLAFLFSNMTVVRVPFPHPHNTSPFSLFLFLS